MRLIKHIFRKLYHLFSFLSVFVLCLFIFNDNVKADVISITGENIALQACTGSGSCSWVTSTNFYNGVNIATSSSSRRPRTFGWNVQFNANNTYTYVAKFTLSFYYDYNYNLSGYWYFKQYLQSSGVTFGELNGLSKDVSCTTGSVDRASDGSHFDKVNVTCIFKPKNSGSNYYFLGITNSNYTSFGSVPYGSGTAFTVENRSLEGTADNSQTIINQNQTIINQNQQQIQEQKETQNKINETNGKLDNIDDTMNDQSVNLPNNGLNNIKGNIPTNSVISDLILLPVSLLQKLVNALSGSCANFSLGSLYNHDLVMPCIDIESYVGSSIWVFIDFVFSGMFILVIRKKFIQIFQNITSLKNGGNEVD